MSMNNDSLTIKKLIQQHTDVSGLSSIVLRQLRQFYACVAQSFIMTKFASLLTDYKYKCSTVNGIAKLVRCQTHDLGVVGLSPVGANFVHTAFFLGTPVFAINIMVEKYAKP